MMRKPTISGDYPWFIKFWPHEVLATRKPSLCFVHRFWDQIEIEGGHVKSNRGVTAVLIQNQNNIKTQKSIAPEKIVIMLF